MSLKQSDVVVVGAGPSGLLLACELALGGVDVQVLERLVEPDRTVKAGSINVATVQILARHGLLPELRAAHERMSGEIAEFADSAPVAQGWQRQRTGQRAAGFPVGGHVAAMMFRPELVDQDDPELRVYAGASGATLVSQRDLEAILLRRATSLGVQVLRGVEIVGLEQDENGVTLQTSGGEVRAGWVVAADGGRSTIRKAVGIDFPGTGPEIVGYQAIAALENADALRPGWTWTPAGVCSYGPIPGRVLTVRFATSALDRSTPVTREEIEYELRTVTGTDVRVRELLGTATRWTDNARQAASYRSGRVLLVGDAAHVHSPFSGQGLNLGIGDVANLGWKLAAAVRGDAAAGLVDSYDSERRPIGAWVLDWTRAQVALLRGDEKTEQLRIFVEQELLGTVAGMTRVVRLASGIAVRYDGMGGGAIDLDEGRVGRLVGDIDLEDGSRLVERVGSGRFVLLDGTVDGWPSRTIEPWSARVDVVRESTEGVSGMIAGMLVRPDGVVAWVSERPTDQVADEAALALVLHRWVGDVAC